MMRCEFRIVCVAWVCLSAVGAPAFASRASLLGRGLPPFLALDPSGLRYFPGTAAAFDRLVLLDYSESGYSENLQPVFSNLQGDRFATVLVGDRTRFAYVLDGRTHNLLLGTSGGFGLVVGFSDAYDRWSYSRFDTSETLQRSNIDSTKVSETSVRLGTSWGARLDSGRLIQLSAGGSWFDSEMRSSSRYEQTGQPVAEGSVVVESDPGWGFDVTLRTLTDGEGLNGVVQYIHEDRNPTMVGVAPSEWKRQLLAADLGWRVTVDVLDDFVVGLHGAWRSVTEPNVSRYGSLIYLIDQDSYFGGIFVSGEKFVSKWLVIRAGVLGSGYFERDITSRINSPPPPNTYSSDTEQSEYGQIESPRFFLGAGMSWKQFQVDAQIRESFTLDYPIIRWSATMTW